MPMLRQAQELLAEKELTDIADAVADVIKDMTEDVIEKAPALRYWNSLRTLLLQSAQRL